MEECCGKCKHHKAVIIRGKNCHLDWFCDNEDSEYYTDYTGYSDGCDEFEER